MTTPIPPPEGLLPGGISTITGIPQEVVPPWLQVIGVAVVGIGLAVAAGARYLQLSNKNEPTPGQPLSDQIHFLGAALNDNSALREISAELREWRSARAIEAEREVNFRREFLERLDAANEGLAKLTEAVARARKPASRAR